MASGGLFGVYGCIPGLSFYSFFVFSLSNSVSLHLHFFLCRYVFFYVFAIRNSSLVIVAFFCCCGYGFTVLLFLCLFLCSYAL